jgi:hypothetical protein
MNMKHKTGVTYQEVLEVFDQSKKGEYLNESIQLRDDYIHKIVAFMSEDERDFTKAIEFIKKFLGGKI